LIWRELKKLQAMLSKYQGILEMMEPDIRDGRTAALLSIATH
jgi:hypothetical protein